MPTSKPLSIALTLLALMHSTGIFAQATQEADTSVRPVQGPAIIELDEQQQTPGTGTTAPETQTGTTVTPASGGRGVEMIVGGQGNGGVAKKATLPVVD